MTAMTTAVTRRFGRRDLTRALIACGGATAVFAAASGHLVPGLAIVGVLAVLLLAAAALRWTAAAVCSALVVISCVPVYWGRPAIGLTIVAVPALGYRFDP